MKNSNAGNIRKLVSRAYDLHYHIGPEIIPRKFDSVSDLIRAEKGKIKGIALKNHFYPTQPFITGYAGNTDIDLIGGIVLNSFQGGLNPEAVYANSLLSTKPTIVWLPTVSAKHFLDESEYEIAPEWVGSKNFSARKARDVEPVLIDHKINAVLQAIKDCNSVLATGHISWEETVNVVKKANAINLEKIIVTHPIYDRINFPIQEQIKLTKLGAKMEHCYSMFSIDKIPVEKIAEQIKAVGAENCVLSSDVGQKFSPSSSEALFIFAEMLTEQGITFNELAVMLVQNPKALVR